MLRIMDTAETWRTVAAGASIARYGDGELVLMKGKGIRFQRPEPALAERLRQVIRARTLLIGVPPIVQAQRGELTDTSPAFVQSCIELADYCDPAIGYGDAFMSRLERQTPSTIRSFMAAFLGTIAGRSLVLVKGAGQALDLELVEALASRVTVIEVPAQDAWSERESILRDVRAACGAEGIAALSIGPTATVLAHDLVEAGVAQAIDLGHFWVTWGNRLNRRPDLAAVRAK